MSVTEAARVGDVKQLKKLLKAGGDANELGAGSTTALIEAAAGGHADAVALLLEHGAEPALTDDAKETALMKAAANGHHDVVELLLPHASDDEADTARAYLKANANPELRPERESLAKDGLMWRAARATASIAGALGHDSPQQRIDRQEQAEREDKKKR